MSKEYGKLKLQAIDKVSVKYSKSKQEFTFKCGSTTFKISELKLRENMKFNCGAVLESLGVEGIQFTEKDFMKYEYYELELYEEVDMDAWCLLSNIQYQCCLSPSVLKLIKRNSHLYKLGKVDNNWYDLSFRITGKAGRPKGSKNKVSSAELERIEFLKQNYDTIVSKLVAMDHYYDYLQLEKDLGHKVSEAKKKFLELRKKCHYN